MASTSSSKVFVQLTSQEEGNWLSLGRALTSVLCQGLRLFIKQEVETFYKNVTAATAAPPAGPCTCVFDPRRKKNQYHDMTNCAWAKILQAVHLGNRPNWKQSDSTKWLDPNIGPWEIAKLFLPDIGAHTIMESVEDMEITGILNLMLWCNHFNVQRPLIKDVRDIRNTKWAHVPKLELSEAEKKAAFETIEKLLQDPELAGDAGAQRAIQDIVTLKSLSDVHIFKAEVLSHYEEAIRNDVTSLQSELKTLKKESKKNKKQRSCVEGRLRNLQKALEKIKVEKSASVSVSSVVLIQVLAFINFLAGSAKGMRRKSITNWLILVLLFCFPGILDHKSYKDGCPVEENIVPFDTKEFNLTDYLAVARENFIGRRWLFQEVENAFNPAFQHVPGVLVIGDPGAGKSALSAQLVCSRTSSRTIHDHVLGYHLCKHSDKNTQNAGKFVRNLAQMIASRLPEYGYIVTNSSFIQRSLNTDCVTIQDPVGCFEQAILTPLRSLTNEPKENWYIVIDALDECLTQSETSHSIVYLLNNKMPRFPSWLKLVMTSRNESSVSLNSNSITKLIIDPEDNRNMEDIELFLTTKIYQEGPLLYQIKSWFGDNSIENTAKLIHALLSKSQGNFLFVKEMLHHWETSKAGKGDPYVLPETLGELYNSYFERLYNRPEQFQPIRRVLELLVATFHPMSLKEIYDILRMREVHLDEDYDFRDRIKELGHFLRYGKNDSVTLYHLSLTEWLTSERNRNSPFYVSKKRGHEVFCEFYFSLIAGGDKTALTKYILTLAQHIAYGGWKEAYVNEFLRFPSQVVNSSDPESNRTLLHLAATINSTDVLELLLRHFSCIDCVDNRGITPAFLAAEHGLVHNLALMVKRGARVNRKTKSLVSIYEVQDTIEDTVSNQCGKNDPMSFPVLYSKSKLLSSTMLHAAAHGGHLEVVSFLLDNGAFISTVDGVHLTALQIAAEQGHLGVVKALHEAGAVPDQTALHHAAANNRLEVVRYLLQMGVQDRCMRCDGSFYWLQTKHRLQSGAKLKPLFRVNKTCLSDETELRYLKDGCLEREVNTSVEFGELFDDKHLIFCETALQTAVSTGQIAVIKELLSKGTGALACTDYTGRTPLHEAVRKNNSEIVKLLLMKDHTMIHKTCNHWQSVREDSEKVSLTLNHDEAMEYHGDICHCGYTPLHLAARYGYWKIGLYLILRGADKEARDCFGATPLHLAACHNQRDFVNLLMHENADINSRSSNGSTPLHSAAACAAVEVIHLLLYHGANITAVDKNGLSPLHYSILYVHPSQLDREIIWNETSAGGALHLLKIDRRGRLARFYEDDNLLKNTEHYRWLDTFIDLILHGSDVDAVDEDGRSSLHLAAKNGLADAVNVLLQRKAKFQIRDKLGKTPLEIAVENSTVQSKPINFIHGESFDQLKLQLRDHEMVVHLLLSSGASFKKCSRNDTSLLQHAFANNQPYIAQLLVLKGASTNCKDNQGRTPLIAFLLNGGDWASFPFKHMNKSVKIKCGKPFKLSELHLLCYLPPKVEDDNFFQRAICDHKMCSSKKSPFITAIESHRLKYKVIDSCLDAEGFTPLHRAAQGANIVAVRSLIKHGANLSLVTPQGYDALTLAALHSGGNIWPTLFGNETVLEKDMASTVAIELLHHAMKTRGFQIVCDYNKPELTLYHLASSRGLVKFIQAILKDKGQHQIDVNCSNSDGITPLYLAKVFSSQVPKGDFNPWKEVVRIIESHGGKMSFPSRDSELITIYNRLYGWIPKIIDVKLRPDVRSFVVGLPSTFEYWKNNSVYCSLHSLKEQGFQVGFPSSVGIIQEELLRQLELVNRRRSFVQVVSFALEDIKLCQSKAKSEHFLLKTASLLLNECKSKVLVSSRFWNHSYQAILSILPVKLYYLMRMWHKEVFENFACIKMVSGTYRPYFVDDRQLRRLIARYEKSIPIWYLGYICSSFETAFHFRHLYFLRNNTNVEFAMLYHNYPPFINGRLKWPVDQLGFQIGSWPFEFLVKVSLGLYQKYDYLNVLNVGLEPKTRVALLSDKMGQILQQVRERYNASMYKSDN
ncbi:uncharacterized protein [Montipora capricornis]|uniref:uncharacterized protein n=1 Tax=Montipora capricornis TaxID=246305 RepID=UPI0035F11239